MNSISPHNLSFPELLAGLEAHVANGYINTRTKGNLKLYDYDNLAIQDKLWDVFTINARGLILDIKNQEVISWALPKFHNHGELGETDPIDITKYKILEKMDGSCLLVWWYNNKWNCSTRGSFDSSQALAAQAHLDKHLPKDVLKTHLNYIFEYTAPDNRIVVSYPETKLSFITAFSRDGKEIDGATWSNWSRCFEDELEGFGAIKEYTFNNFQEIINLSEQIDHNNEGWVVWNSDTGHRVKIKGKEYLRLHKLISRITPIGVWEMLMFNDDIEVVRRQLPEEFLKDFNNIVSTLADKVDDIYLTTLGSVEQLKHLPRKDFAQIMKNLKLWWPNTSLPTAFMLLDGRPELEIKKNILKGLRPTGNIL